MNKDRYNNYIYLKIERDGNCFIKIVTNKIILIDLRKKERKNNNKKNQKI